VKALGLTIPPSLLLQRQAHHRKAGFMASFERLAAGYGPSDAPSFLDRARNRWSARAES